LSALAIRSPIRAASSTWRDKEFLIELPEKVQVLVIPGGQEDGLRHPRWQTRRLSATCDRKPSRSGLVPRQNLA
jgi:hypothetical protein